MVCGTSTSRRCRRPLTNSRHAGGTVHPYIVDVSSADAIANAAQMVREDGGPSRSCSTTLALCEEIQYFWGDRGRQRDPADDGDQRPRAHVHHPRGLPGMIRLDTDCRIVNIASSAGLSRTRAWRSTQLQKLGSRGLVDSVRPELEQAEHTHIKITTVCPTYINTGITTAPKASS